MTTTNFYGVPPGAPLPDYINLEGLRDKLLAPRKIERDMHGYLVHPDYPICDEGTRADKFLEAFGIESAFVDMESDAPEALYEAYMTGADVSAWWPTPPEGDGWVLLEIYDTENGPYAMFARRKVEEPRRQRREPHFDFDFVAHLERQRVFSERIFGPGMRTKMVVDHIRKELVEIEANPSDITEWVDVILLAFDGAWRSGATPMQIAAAIEAKQTKNEGRIWPDWRNSDPNKAIEHDRSADTSTSSVGVGPL